MAIKNRKSPQELRSARWFANDDLRGFGHRSRAMQMGYTPEDWRERPVIAMINTWSDINPCHAHLRERAKWVQRGILQEGGWPIELPALSLAENYVKPTTMLYRNFLAMETEELIRSHPIDGAVLLGGCDKTTPGLVLGAISAGVPFIFLPAGPMLRGNWKGNVLGSGSDTWKFWDERRAGKISDREWTEIEGGIARSYGHCMTMGTASTMTAITDTLGLCLPGASSIPAPDSAHQRMSANVGRRAVHMVWENLTPNRILTRSAFDNAIIVAMAMGCSTNAVIHLIAMGRRAGHDVTLNDFDAASRTTPVLANIRPSGDQYLMEDFFYAGGLPGLWLRLEDQLDKSCLMASGETLAEVLTRSEVYNDDVIRKRETAIYPNGALAVLTGNLAPNGCVIKPSACSAHLQVHTGPALVFDSYLEMKKATDDPNLDVTSEHILVLRNAGPLGGPGMPEWGMLPIPIRLVREGVRDMLRLSDARMSGTSYGACILHVAPEAHIGGPLALVKTGDLISVNVPKRQINMQVSKAELQRRQKTLKPAKPRFERGYGWLAMQHIKQANEGCDFDYLETNFGAAIGEPDIF
ncbi:MAG: L-arabinonate dehydratase [Paracoccaceae bacterium]|nr:L-arabinonate dehydratase [Paracoccaceae bacterium]